MCQTSVTSVIVNIYLLIFCYHCQYAIAICPLGCVCDDFHLKTICKSEAHLEYVPHTLNPSIRELRLSDNHIRGIKSSLSVYKSLSILDISSNQIASLEDNDFADNNQLNTLIMNKNLVTSLQNDTFKGLSALEKLFLSENMLQQISSGAFRHLRRLQILDVSYNKISFISEDAFEGLQTLRTLNIRANQLNSIPSAALFAVTSLAALDLGLNKLTTLTNNAFSALTSLDSLFIDSCALTFVDAFAFKNLRNLTVLRLQNNFLRNVPKNAFSELKALEVLQIGDNKFATISQNAFSHLINLKSLQINRANYLTNIEIDAFKGLINLEKFELSFNKLLDRIDARMLSGLPNLRFIILRSNAFSSLDLSVLFAFERNYYIDVRDNPFVCNCSLDWLRTYLIQIVNNSYSQVFDANYRNSTNEDTFSYKNLLENITLVMCHYPSALKSKLIIELQKDDFGCFELDTKVPIIIAILIGILLLSGVIVMFVIHCRYRLAGLVKNKWPNESGNCSNGLRNDLNFRKTDFVFIPNIDLNNEESNRLTITAMEEAIRCPLKMTPMTEL